MFLEEINSTRAKYRKFLYKNESTKSCFQNICLYARLVHATTLPIKLFTLADTRKLKPMIVQHTTNTSRVDHALSPIRRINDNRTKP